MVETLAVVFGVAVLAGGAVVIKYWYWPPDPDDEPREDVAEYISMMVGVLYALVLGLALVTVWDSRSAAEGYVQSEAGAAHQVWLLAEGLPPQQAERLRTGVDTYVHHVVATEWPAMTRGNPLGKRGWELLNQVRAAAEVPADANPAQQVTALEATAQLSKLDDARRGREAAVESGLSPVLWFGLFVGGTLTVAFMFLFGVQRSLTHVVMVMGLSALIAFVVLLIYQLNTPFSGLFAVDATPFTRYFTSR
ncbi:DUF4239 domain-containing protein [Streptomyces spectabilis]|uniref:DUF4239 domain-containing protein n=1 Tax=Streptomyces spectabilis TaxID=68270 RepID=A0A516R1Q2_STRST|nr:DUF4239 domain-containing protein [Streptomyces spectabilis]QDQ09550.1 DUF4239 domain-containing protein [Streptomyces spectabilis]